MNWLLSANPKIYNHEIAFERWGFIDWAQKNNYSVGDIVYIYITSPEKRIGYKTFVEKINLNDDEYIDDSDLWKNNQKPSKIKARLRLIEKIDDEGLSLENLRLNGLIGVPESQANKILFPTLLEYIESFFSQENSKPKIRIRKSEKEIRISNIVKGIDSYIDELSVLGEEKESIVKIRTNQSIFRTRLLEKYNHQCCLCSINDDALLIASHIKPWAKCEDGEKLRTDNGLLLCPIHDKLFDKGYISFDEDGNLLPSSRMTKNICETIGLTYEKSLELKVLYFGRMSEFMEYHRNNIFIDSIE